MIAGRALPSVDGMAGDPSAVIDHPSGFLGLCPRNQRFTVAGILGFLAFREQGRHLIVLGGIHAPVPQQADLLDRFLAFAEARRRRVIVVQLRAPQIPLFFSRGFTINQLGTSFAITLRRFTLRGSEKMQLRNKLSRARRAGLRIAEVGVDLPRSEATFARLHAVSRAWLEGKGGKELDFMIGELGRSEEAWRRIFVALDPAAESVAFITYVPARGCRPGYLHDLTRRLPTAPPGALELINAHVIEQMIAQGVPYLHLGFTPFVVDGAEPPGASGLAAWLIRALYRHGGALYPAATQARYKLKWTPDVIEREYIAVRPLSVRAIFDLLLLTRVL